MTLEQFVTTSLDTAAVDQNKYCTIKSKKQILRDHLIPAFGHKRLDAISTAAVEEFKAAKVKAKLSPKIRQQHAHGS